MPTVASGVISNGITDNTPGSVWSVFGTANNFLLNPSTGVASMVVFNGGLVSNSTIDTGSFLMVNSGGSSIRTSIGNSASAIFDDAVVSDLWAFNAAHVSISGGTFVATSDGGGVGNPTVMTASGGAILNGGVIYDAGTLILSKATATSFTDLGTLSLGAGGIANEATVTSTGQLVITSGGEDVSAIVTSSGVQIVRSGGSSVDTEVSSGGTEILSLGGVDAGGTVASGGTILVSSGGKVLGDTIGNGGYLIASSGGIVSSAAMTSGGTLSGQNGIVLSNLTATGGTYIQSGAETIDAANADSFTNTTIVATGGASGGVLLSALTLVGDTITLSSGAADLGDTIGSGTVISAVNGGVIASSTFGSDTLVSGATVYIGAGGTLLGKLNNGTLGAGEVLILASGANVSNAGGGVPFVLTSGAILSYTANASNVVLPDTNILSNYGGTVIDAAAIANGSTVFNGAEILMGHSLTASKNQVALYRGAVA